MKNPSYRGSVLFALAGFLLLSALLSGVAGAQVFNFGAGTFTTANVCANSATPAASCQILTNGSPNRPRIITGGILRLNTATTNQHASAWFRVKQPLNTGFTTAFQFNISNTGACSGCAFPADGMALVIQGDAAGTGALGYTGNGQNISYGNNDLSTASGVGRAIRNSLAVELDTFKNADYADPNGNHIAVQSCGPNNATTLSPNSADHNYLCADGKSARLALQSLPAGLSLSDGKTHTITVNYLPPGNCTTNCNNFSVFLDSTLILQTTLDITQQLRLDTNGGAYIGFTAATGSSVQNDDIVSWSFSKWPLSPITIIQPLQAGTTNFSYTSDLTASTDYSGSGLPPSSFTGVFQQGTVQAITDQQFADLVNNTPFQGSTCLHQDLGNGTFGCVTTTDLCTTATNTTPSGANCPNTGTSALIKTSNNFNAEPAQKPIIAPGYIMGKDTALSCGAAGDNNCKGLSNIFDSITGDPLISGTTKNFNSVLIPVVGVVQPSTSTTTSPTLNNTWANQPVTVTFQSIEVVPSNIVAPPGPPSPLPDVTSIGYSVAGANVPTTASGTITGNTGQIIIPADVEGTTIVTFSATDTSGTPERVVTTDNSNQVTTSLPTLTINIDKTAPTFSCTPPAAAWTPNDVSVPCTESDNAGGSGPATPTFSVSTSVPGGTETNTAMTVLSSVADVAGNTVPVPAYGPFQVDKKAPVITGPTISPASPVFGDTVTANFSCTDGGSGVVLCDPDALSQKVSTTSPATGSVGTHTFTVNAADAVGNASTPSSVTYTVGKAAPVITWANPADITYGTALDTSTQLNATANVPGVFVYTPAAGTQLNAGTGQTLKVDFTPTDTTNYTTATKSVLINVNQATPVITWATPAAITYGTALSGAQLNATANVTGSFAYTPAGGVLNAGSQTLSVSFTPTDTLNYRGASKSVSIAVNRATTTTTITSTSPSPGIPGSPVRINVSVVGSTNVTAPTGTVTVTASTLETCSAAVSAGGCSLTFATTGARNVTASYGGDLNFQGSSTSGSVQVIVGDFSITATPASQTISSGHQATYTITVTPIGGLTGVVNLSCSGAPPNSTCSVSPSVDNLSGAPVNSTVTLSANKNVNHGTFNLTFTGSYGGGALVHSVSVSLTVKGQS